MMKPIIAISSNYGLAPDADPPREQSYLLAAYSEAVYAAGGIPRPLPVPHAVNPARVDELLDSCDGLLLTGGYDLDPRHYGQSPHPKAVLMHPRRDRLEVVLVRRADERRYPTLAICLGFQILHVIRGGRLVQHLDDLSLTPRIVHHLPRDANALHAARIEPGSRLAAVMGTLETEVSSRHHQLVDPAQPGRGLRPVAWAPDGVLEASEDCDGRFLLAVQWHPEDQVDRPEHLRLFEALVDAAR